MEKLKGRRRRGTPKPNRSPAYSLYARIDKDISEAFEELVENSEPKASKKAHLELALKDYLTNKGIGRPKA
jgi:hypothetical protein